jgi:hypothetical protein
MLVSYVRDKKNRPIGCVVAVKDESYGFKIGLSKCHTGERFRKTDARNLAIERANESTLMCSSISLFEKSHAPFCFAAALMTRRAMKYFKVQ